MAATPTARNRSSLAHQARYALRHPARVPAHARRAARDAWLRLRYRGDHIAYYRAVMASDTARSAEAAVGHNPSRESWERIGRMQFDYLVGHGLKPHHRMLDIGCGNLRAGRLFIDYLDTGNYYGIDISPHILLAAQDTLVREGLQAKLPHLTLADDLTLAFLPDAHFDVVHAHSVFSHSPRHVIDECFAHVGRVLAPEASSTSRSTARRARSTRCCARTSTTARARWSPWPPGTASPPGSWTTGRSCRTVSRRSG